MSSVPTDPGAAPTGGETAAEAISAEPAPRPGPTDTDTGATTGSAGGTEARTGGADGDTATGSAVHGDGSGDEGRPGPVRRTRRFPLFTKDTARPEGGGRAAPGDAPAPARQWPMLAVLLLGGLGLLLTAFDLSRAGTLLVGLALVVGAALRWALPSVGMLAVRSRFTDLVTYGVLGVGIMLLALMAQPDPWLEIPFLDDVLHYTLT